jgi:hypothetical protein
MAHRGRRCVNIADHAARGRRFLSFLGPHSANIRAALYKLSFLFGNDLHLGRKIHLRARFIAQPHTVRELDDCCPFISFCATAAREEWLHPIRMTPQQRKCWRMRKNVQRVAESVQKHRVKLQTTAIFRAAS